MKITSAKISSSDSSLVFDFTTGLKVKKSDSTGELLINEGDLILKIKGDFLAKIYRDKKLTQILSGNELTEKGIKGQVKSGDRYILATPDFFEKISEESLIFCLDNLGAVDTASKLSITLDNNEEVKDTGAIILYFEGEAAEREVERAPLVFFPNLVNKIKSLIPQKRILVNAPIEDEVFESKKKTTFSVGLLLLFILFVSIVFGIKAKNDKEFKSTYEETLIQSINDLNEAKSLASVDATKARELFAKSEEGLNEIKKLNVKDPKVEDLEKRLTEERGEIMGEYKVAPTLYSDLTLLASGFSVSNSSVSDGYLFLLDANQKKLVQIEIENKKSKVVASSDKIDGVKATTNYLDTAYGLFDDGIYSVDGEKKKVIEKDWEGDVLIYSYSGNFYILNKSDNKIYRYSAIGGGEFSGKQEWLSSGSSFDFSNTRRWVFDGSVYIQTSDAKVLKLAQGSPQGFALTGIFPSVNKIDDITTNENNLSLYLLDKEHGRVVVTDKKGAFEVQYLDDRFKEAKSIVADEDLKKLLIITSDKIYSVDLKHL